MALKRTLLLVSLFASSLTGGVCFAQVTEAPMFRSPSDLPEALVREAEAAERESYYDEGDFIDASWDGGWRPPLISFGGKVLASTTNGPNLYGAGGAFTLGLEWLPLYTCDSYATPITVSPILGWDIGGVGTLSNTQLDDAPAYRTADGYFFTAIQPGLRIRKALHEGANGFIQGGLDVRYLSTEFTPVTFNPQAEQIPVDMWVDDDWTAGYFLGGGIEYAWGSHAIRTSVNFESFNTELMTGYGHQESQIGVAVELIRGR